MVVWMLVGCSSASSEPLATPTYTPEQIQGKQVFTQHCGSCHSLIPDTIIVGPSLAGIATRAATRQEGMDATGYIMHSILQPDAYIVEGFDNLMPVNFGKKLTGEELDEVVAFLLLQK